MTITYKNLKSIVAIYSALPIVIFFIGWLNIAAGTVFTLLLSGAIFFLIRSGKTDDHEHDQIVISKKQLITLALIAFGWCVLAGQGGFLNQTSDHFIRNAILRDMICEPWPVTYNDDRFMLCYYIAHWMLPSVIGKAVFLMTGTEFAGILAGHISLLIWTWVGTVLTLLLITMVTGNEKKPRPVLSSLIFIFFSGLDAIFTYISGQLSSPHMEWWAGYFQYSSNTTCLFWVYNQTVVIWLVTLCIINEKRIRSFAAIGMLAFPYGPFPFVGIVLLCLIKALFIAADAIRQKKLTTFLKDIPSPQNFWGIVAIAPVFILYYTSNSILSENSAVITPDGVAQTEFRLHSFLTEAILLQDSAAITDFILKYLLFIFLEIGIFIILIIFGNKGKQDKVLLSTMALLIILPLFQIGIANDLCMRVSIPALLYLCVGIIRLVKQELPEKGEISSTEEFLKRKTLLTITAAVLFIGALNPFTEMRRAVTDTFYYGNMYTDLSGDTYIGNMYGNITSLEEYEYKHNFTAETYSSSLFNIFLR